MSSTSSQIWTCSHEFQGSSWESQYKKHKLAWTIPTSSKIQIFRTSVLVHCTICISTFMLYPYLKHLPSHIVSSLKEFLARVKLGNNILLHKANIRIVPVDKVRVRILSREEYLKHLQLKIKVVKMGNSHPVVGENIEEEDNHRAEDWMFSLIELGLERDCLDFFIYPML